MDADARTAFREQHGYAPDTDSAEAAEQRKADRAARLAALRPAAVDLAAQLADAAAELDDDRPASWRPLLDVLDELSRLRGEAGSALNGWGRASMDANAWRELDRR